MSIIKNSNINTNNNKNRKKERSIHALQLYIDEKLEKHKTELLESIDKKFFYLTNKDQYLHVQKEEITKLIQKLNPCGNHLQNYQTLFKLNEFLQQNPDLTTKIKTQFSDFLNLTISVSTNSFQTTFNNSKTNNCQQALELNTKGDEFKSKNQLTNAIDHYDKAIKLDSTNPIFYYNKGSCYLIQEEYEKAIELFNQSLKLNDKYAEAYCAKADCLYHLNKNDDAIILFEKAIQLNRKLASAYNGKALVLDEQKEYSRALRYFNEAIRLEPNNSDFYYNRGFTLDGLNEGKEAIDSFKKAAELNPNDSDIFNLLGISFKKYKKEYQNALICFTKAIELDPTGNAEYYFNKGECLNFLERYQEALNYFNKAIELSPLLNGDFYYGKGCALIELNQVESAIECFEKAIQLDSNDADYFNDLGYAYYYKNDYPKAVKCFEEAIKLNSSKAEAYNGKGQAVLEMKGASKDVLMFFEKAIEYDKNNSLFFKNKALVYFALKNLNSAISCLDEAIRIEPSNIEFYLYKVQILKMLNENKEAKMCYFKMKDINGNTNEIKRHWNLITQKLNGLISEEEMNSDLNMTITEHNFKIEEFIELNTII